MYGCESWTIKKAECQRTDAFELWCWTRLLRVPWTSRTSNQSILKEIRPGCPLEGLMLSWNSNTLATWWEELTHLKRPWCWERLRTGGEGDHRGWDGWMAASTRCTWVWVDSRSWWWTGRPGVLWFMGLQRVGHDWVTELTDWLNTSWHNNTLCVGCQQPTHGFPKWISVSWGQGLYLIYYWLYHRARHIIDPYQIFVEWVNS